MRFSFRHRADPNTRFAAGAFDSSIGKEIPVNLPDASRVGGRIVAADVAADGRSVELTVELPGEVAPLFGPPLRYGSVSTDDEERLPGLR